LGSAYYNETQKPKLRGKTLPIEFLILKAISELNFSPTLPFCLISVSVTDIKPIRYILRVLI
jgi:hypothetical protein